MKVTDVERGVEVAMARVTTGAHVTGLAAVVFTDPAAGVATLTCIAGVDIDDVYAGSPALVLQLGLEFVETPSPEPCAQLLAPSAAAYTGEVLQYVGANGFVFAHFLRDAVISVPHEPLFPTGDGLEFPPCRPGAFALEPTALKLVLPFSFDYRLAGVFNPVGESGEVIQPPVHANDVRSGSRVGNGDTVREVKCPLTFTVCERPCLYLVRFDIVFGGKPQGNNDDGAHTLPYTRYGSEVTPEGERPGV